MPRRSFACLALAAHLLAGCASPQVEPVHPIAPELRLAVLPFAESHADAKDPERAHALGRETTGVLAERAAFRVCSYERVYEQSRDLESRGELGDLAARLGADLLLACDLELLDRRDSCLQPDPSAGRTPFSMFLRVRARVRVRLLEPTAGEPGLRSVREDQVDLVVPSQFVSEGWFPETEAELQAALVRAVARRVARLYVRHDVERIEVE